MTVTLTWQTVVTAAAVIAAAAAIGTYVAKVVRWLDHQKEQDKRLDELQTREAEDRQEMEDELCIITYGLLACLKGLQEQGCDGPVTTAIEKLEKHINQKAHNQV
mgnify:FL=1